jgi:hypothetical protein
VEKISFGRWVHPPHGIGGQEGLLAILGCEPCEIVCLSDVGREGSSSYFIRIQANPKCMYSDRILSTVSLSARNGDLGDTGSGKRFR